MKKLWCVSVIIIPFIVLVLFTGCPSNSGEAPPNVEVPSNEEVYYLKARIYGTVWEFLYGISDVEPEPFGTFFTTGTVGTELNAQTTESDSTVQPQTFASFFIDSSSTSPATYTITDFIDAYFRLNGTYWDFTSITMTISKYGAVGGTIEGTFSGELLEYQGSATMPVSSGEFKLKRAVNNAW
jgi:hypothetical protein